MKKGCFIKSIVVLTILTAAVLYIVKYKFDDFVLKPGKQILSGVIIEEWAKEIEVVKDSPEKDSLKSMVSKLITGIESKEALFNDNFKSIMSVVSASVQDSIIEISELNYISEKIKAELQNERSTQN
jgi:predicted polyphosphate/ATP-dependent NAD kinase